MNQKGIAMVTAIVLALIVSVIAAVVLSLTFRRFELSAFRTDHMVAAGAAEAGFQYAFARMDQDAAFRTAIQTKRAALGAGAVAADNTAAEYVVTSNNAVPHDELVPALRMGDANTGKNVTVRIRYFTDADKTAGYLPASLSGRPYRIRSSAAFGTGGQ